VGNQNLVLLSIKAGVKLFSWFSYLKGSQNKPIEAIHYVLSSPQMKQHIDRKYWCGLWTNAKVNCDDNAYLLFKILGYPNKNSYNKKYAKTNYLFKAHGGTVPRDYRKQELLRMLGGPHGKTFYRAIKAANSLD
jgi:hypothetical protein